MKFTITKNNTWVISGFSEIIMIAFDNQNRPHILNEGLLEIDYLDGSYYDSDGDEKQLLVKFQNNIISFETLPEDYDFWKGTENCNKEGCLGYITELLNNLQNNSNLEYNIKFDESYNYTEAFLWDLNYSKLNHPEIFSVKN
jgi:hypothetical protein